ncbi:hypothetical protein [Vibrio mediterranei]|uniref:hypothetical protein n=1 Tax=Vibrio mediterranei TaxID=689 RepID=UPI00148C4183|nr:hypothetical protein [Vibrio mediterranei]NOI26714.1 hypothetical protein [Vibrio mediterranei]
MKCSLLFSSLLLSQGALAGSVVDIIYPTIAGSLDKNIQATCFVDGDAFSGKILDKAIRFDVSNMLTGKNEGEREMTCKVDLTSTGESYNISLNTVKFSQGEYGSYAPNYDSSNVATGILVKKRIQDCYIPSNLIFDENCLRDFYGDGKYYLNAIEGAMDTQWHFRDYSSAVGVMVVDNPKT